MSQNEEKVPATSFRRYSFFGFVDVGVSSAKGLLVSSVSIVDNFSLEQVRLEIVEAAAIDYVGFTDLCIFFLISQIGRVFAYKKEGLFCVQRHSIDRIWQWTELDVHLQRSQIKVLCENSSFLQQWSHWNDWMTEQISPTSSGQSSSCFLVCTLFSAFLITNSEGDRSESTIERIFDSRPSRSAPLRHLLDFRVQQACGGNDHIVLLSVCGMVYTSGTGSHGELGHGMLETEQTPKKVEMFSEAEISVVQIAVGGWHSCALTSEGDLYGWGWNNHGQLGYKTDEFSIQTTPHPFDIDQSVGSVYCRNNATFLKLEGGNQLAFGEFQ